MPPLKPVWYRLALISSAAALTGTFTAVLGSSIAVAKIRPVIAVHRLGTPYQQQLAGKAMGTWLAQGPSKKPLSPAKPTKALHQVQGSIQIVRSNLTWLNQKISAETAVINLNRAHLLALQQKIKHENLRLHSTQSKYHAMSLKLARTQAALHQKLQVFANEMQFMQEHGAVSYLSVFVGVHSFSDFISRLFLLVEVDQILSRQVIQVKRIQQQQKVLKFTLAASIRHITLMAKELDVKAKAMKATDKADAQRAVVLVSLRKKALSDLHQSVAEAVNWKKLSKRQPKFLATLSHRLGAINQTLQDLLAMGVGGPMSRQHLYQTLYPVVRPIAKTFSLPIPLVLAIITEESGGHQAAISRTGAIGLMQLEPKTAHWLGLNPYNPETNIVGGCLYLHQLLQLFNGRLALALSAYNAGPKYVIQTQQVLPATHSYVDAVKSLYQAYRAMVYLPPAPIPIATKAPHDKPSPHVSAPSSPITLAYGDVRTTRR